MSRSTAQTPWKFYSSLASVGLALTTGCPLPQQTERILTIAEGLINNLEGGELGSFEPAGGQPGAPGGQTGTTQPGNTNGQQNNGNGNSGTGGGNGNDPGVIDEDAPGGQVDFGDDQGDGQWFEPGDFIDEIPAFDDGWGQGGGQPEIQPAYPNLQSPCLGGVNPNCVVQLAMLLEGKLLFVESRDTTGVLYREYLFLCPSRSYTYMLTVYDGVSPSVLPNMNQFFAVPQGERLVFLTTNAYIGDMWDVQAVGVDAAIQMRIGVIEPVTPEFHNAIGRSLYFVINTDQAGNIYLNGNPIQTYLPGDTCFGE